MKSLKERQKEKAIRLAKEEKKLSGKVISYRISLPCVGSLHMTKNSDFEYIKRKARTLVNLIRSKSCYQLYEELKRAIKEKEKEMEEANIARAKAWGLPVGGEVRIIIPPVNLPETSPSPTPFDELPVPTSGEALSHTVENTITDVGQLATGQLDSIVQQGLTIPMDFVYSLPRRNT